MKVAAPTAIIGVHVTLKLECVRGAVPQAIWGLVAIEVSHWEFWI